jgi:hypothetical protein
MTTYYVYFGEAGSMELVVGGGSDPEYDIPVGGLQYGIEYEWQVNVQNDYGISYGPVWSFIATPFFAPTDISAVKRLIVAADSKIFYEDI